MFGGFFCLCFLFVCFGWFGLVFIFFSHDGLWLFYIIGTFAVPNRLDYFCLLSTVCRSHFG